MYRIAILILVLILGGLQYRLWFGNGSWAQVQRLTEKRDQLQTRNQHHEKRNAAMQAQIADLKSGEAATAGRARADMGMIKRGETFFLTVGQSSQSRRVD